MRLIDKTIVHKSHTCCRFLKQANYSAVILYNNLLFYNQFMPGGVLFDNNS